MTGKVTQAQSRTLCRDGIEDGAAGELGSEAFDFFRRSFKALTGCEPFPWQEEAFRRLTSGLVDRVFSLPTGTGKTSLMPVWLIALAWQAGEGCVRLPRRLVWVVDRRTVVDQATDLAEKLAASLEAPDGEDTRDLARRLASLSYLGGRGGDESPLAVSTLRGQRADNREWSRDPSRPAIVVGTVDMVGSRLLFSGYGDGPYHRPIHAGLLGCDAWIVLDEAHLSPAFEFLLRRVEDLQTRTHSKDIFPPFFVSFLTATPRGGGREEDGVFNLSGVDRACGILGKRLCAVKKLRFTPLKKDNKTAEHLVEAALRYRDACCRTLVYVNAPKTALEVAKQIRKKVGKIAVDRVAVLVGPQRGMERNRLASDNEVFKAFKANPDRKPLDHTLYLVATSAGEVGVDLDADYAVCELAALDSMLQRFGRVNRLGGEGREAEIEVLYTDNGDDLRKAATLEWLKQLPQVAGEYHDASPEALGGLMRENPPRPEAFSGTPVVPPLDRCHLDWWSLTSIRASDWPSRPEVGSWLRGSGGRKPETWIAWRREADLLSSQVSDEAEVEKFFHARRILPHERIQEPGDTAEEKIKALATVLDREGRDAGVLVFGASGIWRGKMSDLPGALDKGEVRLEYAQVVLSPAAGGLTREGLLDHKADKPSEYGFDVADKLSGGDADKPRGALCLAIEEEDGWVLRALELDGRPGEDILLGPSPNRPKVFDGMRCVAEVRLETPDGNGDECPMFLMAFSDPRAAEGSGDESLAQEKQYLRDHCARVADVAADLARKVCLPDQMVNALWQAGKWHDSGKKRSVWQRACGNANGGEPLAKPRDGRFDWCVLAGYRHEFGSLLDMLRDAGLGEPARHDLVLHLVAAHHSGARPHFDLPKQAAKGGDVPLEDQCKEGIEAVRRFARLQEEFGWWRLAWLEALLKAADGIVSAGLDKAGGEGGGEDG